MNSVQITGKLCRGGEYKELESGKQLFSGSIAYWNSYRKDTEFYRFVIFGKSAYYFNEWATAGDMIGLEGRLSTSKWKDKKTGADRTDVSITATDFDILTPRKKDAEPDDDRPDNKDFPEDAGPSGPLPF